MAKPGSTESCAHQGSQEPWPTLRWKAVALRNPLQRQSGALNRSSASCSNWKSSAWGTAVEGPPRDRRGEPRRGQLRTWSSNSRSAKRGTGLTWAGNHKTKFGSGVEFSRHGSVLKFLGMLTNFPLSRRKALVIAGYSFGTSRLLPALDSSEPAPRFSAKTLAGEAFNNL